MNKVPYIYVHADDYGMTPESCRRIQDCWEHGCLNSISIMPNGCLGYEEHRRKKGNLACAIHINLVEGRSLVPAEQIGLLAGPDGYMKHSFFGLLMLSLSPERKKLESQLYLEIKAQVLSAMQFFQEGEAVFLDSHQHTHMIPLVFKTVLRAVKDAHVPIRYMRIAAEPIVPFLLEPSLYRTYRPINLIKNAVINFLWLFDRKAFQDTGISSALFCGIVFSGNMDVNRVMKVFDRFFRIAEKRGCDLEFLFHPGYVEAGENFMDPLKVSFQKFYRSSGRKTEYAALHDPVWCEFVKRNNKEAADTLL